MAATEEAEQVEGRLYTWGVGQYGRLGLGDEEDQSEPKQVPALRVKGVRFVTASCFHTCAVTADGRLYTWGLGGFGRLGHGDRLKKVVPKAVASLFGKEVQLVSCGYLHTMAVTTDGQLYTWGGNRHGQLGHGSTSNELLPREVASLEGKNVKLISCGYFHSACVTDEGHIYTWGCGGFGRLGHGERQKRVKPKAVAALYGRNMRAISAGYQHTAAVTADGQVYTWGGNVHGQLGHGNLTNEIVPRALPMLEGQNVRMIACGAHHTAALTASAQVYTWGMNNCGQLGHGDKVDSSAPKLLSALKSKPVAKVMCGYLHSAAILGDGKLYLWGDMDYGRAQRPSTSPTHIDDLTQCRMACCGDYHITVIAEAQG